MLGEDFEEMKVNGPGRYKLGQRKRSPQCAKNTWLFSDLLLALMWRGHRGGTLISASALHHCDTLCPNPIGNKTGD